MSTQEGCNGEDDDCDGQTDEDDVCNKPKPCAPAPCIYTIAGPGPQAGGGTATPYGYVNGAAAVARFNQPQGIAIDLTGKHFPKGTILIADTLNHSIRMIHPTGYVGTYTGRGQRGNSGFTVSGAAYNRPTDIAFGAGDKLVVTDRGNNQLRIIETKVGSVLTRGQNQMADPVALAFDASNDTMYISDAKATDTFFALIYNGSQNQLSQKAGKFESVTSMALIAREKFLFVQHDRNVHCISLFDAKLAKVSDYAGLCNTSGHHDDKNKLLAQFNSPRSLAIDSQGHVYVYDRDNRLIRKIDKAGEVTTETGNRTTGYANGPAKTAQFGDSANIAVDADDNIIIVDTNNHAIRKLILK